MLPALAIGDVVAGAAGIVTGGPVIQQGCSHVGDQIEFLRAAADVLVGRVDEINADVVLGAGPAPRG